MISIRKRTLAFILVIALLVGAGGMLICNEYGVGGYFLMDQSTYKEWTSFRSKYEKLEDIVSFLRDNYYIEIDEEEIAEGAYYGVVDSLGDPYSEYISAADFEDFYAELLGTDTYYGVGITFSTISMEQGYLILSVNTKGPAYEAGVKKGDFICEVDGVDALEYTGDELSSHIRGELGTTVTIKFYGTDGYYERTIERMEIPQESVTYEMLDENIGYIAISQFIADTDTDFKAALKDITAQGAVGFILDIRDNGGGLVSTATNIADELMGKGTIVYTVDHDGNKSYYNSSKGRTDLPYVVLINGNSASASEILAAGIKDNNEGVLVGTQSYGKGIIQNIAIMTDGSALKYTQMQYYSASGQQIHGIGITPDYEIELTEECYNENGILEDDIQLDKAIEVLKNQLSN